MWKMLGKVKKFVKGDGLDERWGMCNTWNFIGRLHLREEEACFFPFFLLESSSMANFHSGFWFCSTA